MSRFQRGLKRKPLALIKKLRKAKKSASGGEKPEPVRTHLRNMIIVPEMIGSVVGVYNGKTFNQVRPLVLCGDAHIHTHTHTHTHTARERFSACVCAAYCSLKGMWGCSCIMLL